MQTKTAQLMPPLAITEIVHATWLFKVLFAAMDLDLFEPLRGGEQDAKFVAKQLQLTEAGTQHLLEGLASMQLIIKKGDAFSLTDVARNYLPCTFTPPGVVFSHIWS